MQKIEVTRVVFCPAQASPLVPCIGAVLYRLGRSFWCWWSVHCTQLAGFRFGVELNPCLFQYPRLYAFMVQAQQV